jgi:hypothetical protein
MPAFVVKAESPGLPLAFGVEKKIESDYARE